MKLQEVKNYQIINYNSFSNVLGYDKKSSPCYFRHNFFIKIFMKNNLEEFKKRNIEKYYTAIVYGKVDINKIKQDIGI